MEEIHRRFSPLLFLVSALSVAVSQLATHALEVIGLSSHKLFYLDHIEPFPHTYFIAPIVIGCLCGICAILFTRFYHFIDKNVRSMFGRLSVMIKFPIIFAIVAAIGVLCAEALGSGHSLVDHLFERKFTFYAIIIFFALRAVMMMISNTAGVTGGIFLPTLAFGAMIGALAAEGFIAIDESFAEYYEFAVMLGMVSFLGATSKIPVTACVFAIEALGGSGNIHAVIIAVTAAFDIPKKTFNSSLRIFISRKLSFFNLSLILGDFFIFFSANSTGSALFFIR
jgi:H+/Cl- antiporter ClcA